MGRPIEIQVDTKVDGAGLDKTADGLGKVSDALDDVATDAKTSGRETERALDGIADEAKDAGTAADKLDRDLTKALDGVSRESKRAGDDLGRNLKRGTDEASEGMQTLRENAESNAKEVAASFDGSFESIADGIQGLVAEATEGYGALGLVGGVAVAAGLGLVTSALSSALEHAQEVADAAQDMAAGARDVAGDAAATADLLGQAWEDFSTKSVQMRTGFVGLGRDITTQGALMVEALDAGVVSADQINAAFKDASPQRRIAALESIYRDLTRASDDLNSSTTLLTPQQEHLYIATSKAATAVQDQIAQEQQAVAINEALARNLGLTVEQYTAQQQAAEDARQTQESYVSALASSVEPAGLYGDALDRARQSAEDAATAAGGAAEEIAAAGESATATLEDVLAELDEKVAARQSFENNLSDLAERGFSALAESLRAGGPEANAALTDLLSKGTDAQVQSYALKQGYMTGTNLAQGSAAGIAAQQGAVQSSVDELYRGIRVPDVRVPVRPQLDTAEADRQFSQWAARPRTFPVSPNIGTRVV